MTFDLLDLVSAYVSRCPRLLARRQGSGTIPVECTLRVGKVERLLAQFEKVADYSRRRKWSDLKRNGKRLSRMDKRGLSERDICTKFITPALRGAGWDEMSQIREEVSFTKGRIIVRGKLVTRGRAKRADYILYFKPNIPIAVIEAKDNSHSVGDGMQQALDYAETLNIPFAFSSNGDGFVLHDRTGTSTPREADLPLDAFPSPTDLWARYRAWKGLTPEAEEIVLQDYFEDGSGKTPRYYQANAVNAAIEATAKGQDRILLVMATGTGKTYTAFQIIWRLWKARRKKRILFLADRNVLIDQTMANDFRPFGGTMTKLSRNIDPSYDVYLGLYQAITGPEERQKAYRKFSPTFFDLIVIDECHRGSAADDSAWREILEYFSSATQIGLTATPKVNFAVESHMSHLAELAGIDRVEFRRRQREARSVQRPADRGC